MRSRAGPGVGASVVEVEQGREGDVQVGKQLPEVVGVPAPERDHRDEGRVEVDAPGLRYGGNDQFLGVALAEHDELGEVQLGVRADRFAHVLASFRGVVRQGDRQDGRGAGVGVEPEVADARRVDAAQDAGGVTDQDSLGPGAAAHLKDLADDAGQVERGQAVLGFLDGQYCQRRQVRRGHVELACQAAVGHLGLDVERGCREGQVQERPLPVAEQPRRAALSAVVRLEPQLGIAQQLGDVRRDRLELRDGVGPRAVEFLPPLRQCLLDRAGSGLVMELAADLGSALSDELAELIRPLGRAPEPTAEERGELPGTVPGGRNVDHLNAGTLRAGHGHTALLAVRLIQRVDDPESPPQVAVDSSVSLPARLKHDTALQRALVIGCHPMEELRDGVFALITVISELGEREDGLDGQRPGLRYLSLRRRDMKVIDADRPLIYGDPEQALESLAGSGLAGTVCADERSQPRLEGNDSPLISEAPEILEHERLDVHDLAFEGGEHLGDLDHETRRGPMRRPASEPP